MKIIKNGNKRFKELYTVHICLCKCGKCGAEFEAQSGEIGDASCGGYYTFTCPYCKSFHSNYEIQHNIRTEEVEFLQVKHYDCSVNKHREVEVKEGGE